MRFEELLHWNDGQFLQPHHFQYLQKRNLESARGNRVFSMPYPWGLIDFELDKEALSAYRVALRRFSAILPDGLEISEPGNCIIKALDLGKMLEQFPSEMIIYAGVPRWSEYEANLAEDNEAGTGKRYLADKKRVRDENSGENEITVITRRLNACLFTNLDEARDMELLPILKLKVIACENAEPVLSVDEKYIPPFMLLGPDCPLFNTINALLSDTKRCRDKLLNTLSGAQVKTESAATDNTGSLLMLRTLNLYEQRISSLLLAGAATPFSLYLELSSFLAELMGFNPMNAIREIRKYEHEALGPVFNELLSDIRSFILERGGAEYTKREFVSVDNGDYLCAALETVDIVRSEEIYIAIVVNADNDMVIEALETGDVFKLTSPQSKSMRTRGVKLSYLRYPPRYLPVLEKTLWFRLSLAESAKVWREICEEKSVLIDYAQGLFPALKASLYITLGP
ncbi:MAG: type VI secretion system baseplate subunit TssK [Spirochaetaceae bacterium]|jgi:type VI secretion system ImpJ/VasE family protein|nr:type VI secretion system baseplate subunit TssK [Spirochaetaceae bacterium]